MFAVIFEVEPKPGRREAYLELGKALRPKLEAIDGFLANERFVSEKRPEKLLSLSLWRDESAVIAWREQVEHHAVQAKGRAEIFADYHLRVGVVAGDDETEESQGTTTGKSERIVSITEWTPADPSEAPPLGQVLDRVLGQVLDQVLDQVSDQVFGLPPNAEGLLAAETFASLYTPGKRLLLAGWRDRDVARRWQPAAAPNGGRLTCRLVEIVRDYGMRDRAEAPQRPEVSRA